MPESTFDPDRVREAQDGDEQARDGLLRRLEPILRGYFIKRIGAETDVDDLVQNTLVRIHKSLDDLEKPGSLKSFAMKAALFELQDYYRGRYDMKEHLRDPDLPLGQSTGPEDRSAHVDVRVRVPLPRDCSDAGYHGGGGQDAGEACLRNHEGCVERAVRSGMVSRPLVEFSGLLLSLCQRRLTS